MINQKTLESLYRKIPALGDLSLRVIGLPYQYWITLSDIEFIVLYTLPGLNIKVTPRTMEYIEARRIKLGLNKAHHKIR